MPAPQYVLRSYGGGADVAQLAQPMGSTDAQFAIAPDTGWVEDDGSPLGTVGPFTAVVDRFTASVEKILCSSIDLVTGVVQVYVDSEDGWSGRGYDGTAPQAHVPGGSTSGVQTCWSSAEAKEANQAVFDVLGEGSTSLVGVPIGSSVPFNGTPLTIPTNFKIEDGSAVSRITYSALFTAITVAATGTTTAANATISGVSPFITPFLLAGMSLTLAASGGAVYTIQSVTSTTIVLTSGTGITAETNGPLLIYPHGAGDGSTTFNIPDSRGRTKSGQSAIGTSGQPTVYVGQAIGQAFTTLTQSQLPTSIGQAAAQAVTDPGHVHGQGGNQYAISISSGTEWLAASGLVTVTFTADTASATTGITTSPSAVTNSGGGSPLFTQTPAIGCTWMIRVL